MSKEKIQITKVQFNQFNWMLRTLHKIAKEYQTPSQLRKSTGFYGLGYEELLEMTYENIQTEASQACKGVRLLNVPNKAESVKVSDTTESDSSNAAK
jgi:hypothetical protein